MQCRSKKVGLTIVIYFHYIQRPTIWSTILLMVSSSQTSERRFYTDIQLFTHTFIVSSANSITAHCLGDSALASSRTMCSYKKNKIL